MVEAAEGNPTTWKFTQCFGDKGDVEDITEADIISTVEFDQTGNYLATGDKGGRVVLFERNETKKTCEYKFHTEFQSHEPEFDYLKSLEIEEKINKIKWCRRQNASHYLLSTNDKTIKLWKVFEKSLKVVAENNLSHELTPGGGVPGGGGPVRNPNAHFRAATDLKLPRLTHHDTVVAAVPRKTYANAHAYHINSISVNSDGETFISSDDLRINLWNLNIQDQSFNIVDIKPANMEELTEVITAAEFHPISCNWFMYASSKGTIKLADMRESALCDQHAKQFEQEEDPSSRSFFSEIISSISDVRFSHDGRYILSRDYLTVKIWDVNMERTPVKTIPIHEHLRPRLCDTYENDSIFDKFEVVFSGDAKNVMTGSYNNNFMIYPSDPEKDTEVVLQADKSAFKAKKVGIPTPMNSSTSPNGGKKGGSRAGSPAAGVAGQGQRMRKETDADQIDFNKKILHMSWHPFEDSIAIAATNNLFVFSAFFTASSDVTTVVRAVVMAALAPIISSFSLIFGGCCANVYCLEAIVKQEPDSGLLITLFQFVFTCLSTLHYQFDPNGRYFLRSSPVPFRKWVTSALLFFTVNMMNNWAFAFNISVPVHIILRSFGSVTTMAAGYLRGKKYTPLQIFSVAVLTLGVMVSAWADASSKGKTNTANVDPNKASFEAGLLVLLIAQLLSAYMGAYVEDVYRDHGKDWKANLFYSHLLSIPMFAAFAPTLNAQFARLQSSHSFQIPPSVAATLPPTLNKLLASTSQHVIYLLANAITQLLCITGVNILSANTSAVTVTIVLNIRKLVSFMLSIWLFGNQMSGLMKVGAIMVFGAGALYGYETTYRLPQKKRLQAAKGKKGQ
ncbi:hypothetical protein OPT61_g1488 [Boeremia exigua]|uniref:Uncharacterized protein n=1 Tax=Boeremia exigua TaxID=749465 RepID=A0ACC2IQC3_9PLEO|nr:hypothetical protein OPT61_g1488 [Boeremia exigua]